MMIFARHGQTEYGKEERYEGFSNSPLTNLGKKQAEQLGIFCKSKKIYKIISSPSMRSLETAKTIGTILKINPEIDKRLREIYYGSWEGELKELLRKTPEWKKRQKDIFNFVHPGYFKQHMGESYKSQYIRLSPLFKELLKENSPVLIISHYGVIRCAVKFFKEIKGNIFPTFSYSNSSLFVVDRSNDKIITNIIDIKNG
ncbi:MAG: histidine phosphatase family protein [Candidatus Levybacteria bacterium]|nr:histidine phosphatase family protein [Candidatus Levybacteria bacterium]